MENVSGASEEGTVGATTRKVYAGDHRGAESEICRSSDGVGGELHYDLLWMGCLAKVEGVGWRCELVKVR